MEYRSDIYIKITTNHLFAAKQILEEQDLMEFAEITQDDDYLYILLPDLKWYASYPEVIAFIKFIESLDKEAGVIAIGEDGNTEHYGFPDEVDLSIETIIQEFM